jgi:NADH:ubiquinone oxidoreductase subunit F (NADH-binding)
MDIIAKLKEADLKGRGGAGFSTWMKWDLAQKAEGETKYVICNASEGEPNVFKDGHILNNYIDDVIEGIDVAMRTIGAKKAYIYINKVYYNKLKQKIEKAIGNKSIVLFKKTVGYIGGEETAACELIEGNRAEPRKRPPFLTEHGLFGCPTLMNNVETFYYVTKIIKGQYKKTRFYSINGDVKKKGVYEFPEDWTVEKVLKETGNYPIFDFFVQVGGGASGEIFLPSELDKPATGAGSITVFNKKKTDPWALMKKWAEFFHTGNCDKCTPCREGAFRIYEMMRHKKIDDQLLDDIFFSLRETSFCALGRGMPVPFKSLIEKVLKK